MGFLHDDILDAALAAIDTDTENLYICSQEPANYAEAQSTYKLGTKATPAIVAPADRSGGGREIVVSAIADGSVDATGTATHWALTDNSASKLLAAGALSSGQAVTSGNDFTLAAFAIGIPDPA